MVPIITSAVESDLPALWNIEEQSFHNPWSKDMLHQEISKPQAYFRVLHGPQFPTPEQPVGFCISWLIVDELHIHQIAIAPRYRRKGLGRLLLEDAMDIAHQQNVERLYLEVRASNEAALGLYQSFHFETVGLRRKYYRDPVEDAVVLVYETNMAASQDDE